MGKREKNNKKKGKHSLHSIKIHDLEKLKEELKEEIENPTNVVEKSPKSKKKLFSFKKMVLRFFQIIFLVIIIFSGIEILKWNGDNQKTKEILEGISEAVVQEVNEEGEIEVKVDFEKLKSMNEQTVAWIKVNNTNVEYPIVQAKDNEYYLTHSFDNSYSKAGWIFADFKNHFDGTDKNMIIYGHNRMDGSMFASLEQTLEEEWYTNPENKVIRLITENEESIYEIFSIYEVEDEEYYIKTDFYSDEAYQNFLNTLKRRSIYDFGDELTTQDQILTLSTCTNYNNGRLVIHAKKINTNIEIEGLEQE